MKHYTSLNSGFDILQYYESAVTYLTIISVTTVMVIHMMEPLRGYFKPIVIISGNRIGRNYVDIFRRMLKGHIGKMILLYTNFVTYIKTYLSMMYNKI